ncbi:MAG: hypothetical protein DMD62_04935 [Gemmatimonadetes bacterium]|nr:MAG: hypothetical protein DMD62_04935 [Gemmatimonadota bacterium]
MHVGTPARRHAVAFALALAVVPTCRLAGQDTTRAVTTRPDTTHLALPADTLRPGVKPMGAFLRSLVLPGWGQAATGRPMTGSVFVAWEGVTAMMTLKARQEANYMKAINSPNQVQKRQEVQDWLVLWIFNHFFSGAEAYVSAHLRDFPPDLKVQAYPGGIGITLPSPIHE